ncbi:double zinc ribbon domain-containing protein [Chromobacterium amazonense]|uniref:double zinc ribbon domain-containing protein n=1 Tax=Chromobacterium amazonense TaxID=1382803 RepID=UPI003D09FDC9
MMPLPVKNRKRTMGHFGKWFGRHHGHHGKHHHKQPDCAPSPSPSYAPPAPATPAGGMVPCPACRQGNDAAARYCQHCGTGLAPAHCRQCGQRVMATAKFCGECGSGLR